VTSLAPTKPDNATPRRADCAPAGQSYASGEQAAAISTALVQLYRRRRGKGPTKAKTYLLEDLVLCVMEGGALPLEETLRDHGNQRLLREVHHALCAAVDDECRTIIERETGRPVKTVLSQREPDCNIECKVVFLD
jgi:uncharacterized protein YbcI